MSAREEKHYISTDPNVFISVVKDSHRDWIWTLMT